MHDLGVSTLFNSAGISIAALGSFVPSSYNIKMHCYCYWPILLALLLADSEWFWKVHRVETRRNNQKWTHHTYLLKLNYFFRFICRILYQLSNCVRNVRISYVKYIYFKHIHKIIKILKYVLFYYRSTKVGQILEKSIFLK